MAKDQSLQRSDPLPKSAVAVLDEPTSALDGPAELAVWRNLEQARAGRTTVVVTHSSDVAKRMDDVVNIRDGRIVEPEAAVDTASRAKLPAVQLSELNRNPA